jgi:uncharacterized membrane protein AbrB (regulator of aidB expression)
MPGEFYLKNWAELFFFILLVIGFIFSLLTPSAVLSYALIFTAGMMGGRLMYERKNKLQFPYYLMIVGFLIGYLIGAYYGNRNVMIILFIIGGLLSYYLHDTGIIRDVRY